LNSEKNTFYCDPCGWGGGVLDFAEALGVELDRPTPPRTLEPRKSLRFEVNGPITDSTIAELANVLGKDYPPDTYAAFGVMEGIVKTKPGAHVAIGFPNGSGWYVVLYRRPDPKNNKAYSFRFTDGAKASLLTAGLDRPGPVLLCEGIWDALRAYTDGFPVATGTGGAGTWKTPWAAQLRERPVVVVYDVDPAGKAGAAKAEGLLRQVGIEANRLVLPMSGERGEKDLSDFRRIHAVDELRRLVEAYQQDDAGLAGLDQAQLALAGAIDTVLGSQLPVRLKRREAANLVIDDLTKRGSLIQAPGGRKFWLEQQRHRLFDLDAFPFRSLFMEAYQINPAEPEFRHILEAVFSEARIRGQRASIYRFCHFNRESGSLYISASQGRVIRLDGDQACWIENGREGVLFEESETPQVIPDNAVAMSYTGDPLDELIFSRVNFVRGSGVILDSDQQRLILRIWMLAIFFPELLPSKVLLLFYGEKGSGKTTTLRVILKLLLGPHADVTPLGKEDGFNATVSQEYLIVLDNVDSHCRWIEDRLATVATGETIKLRKLYTTNEMLSFPTRCFMALTARTPRFRRDDIVDRLQILRVNRLERFSREAVWYAEIEEHRLQLWSQLLHDLNVVVARLRSCCDSTPDILRMADWGFVATTIGEALGKGPEARKALEDSELDKAHFLLEADDLYDLVQTIALEHAGRVWKAGELFAELKQRAEKRGIEFHIKSPKSLGRILHRLAPAIKRMISFDIQTNTHDKQATYVMGPLASTASVEDKPETLFPRDRIRDFDF